MPNRFESKTRRCLYALLTIALAIAGGSITARELAQTSGERATAEVNGASAAHHISALVTGVALQKANTRNSNSDACGLLQPGDIQRVQRERFKDAKPIQRVEGGLRSSQCFYTLATLNKSIVLTVMVKDSGRNARDPREFWNETFHRDREQRRAEREAESEEKEATAEPIKGIGDEAFWTGNRIGSALYVLKGSTLIRLSIGGSDSEETRIRKSRALAQMVITHL